MPPPCMKHPPRSSHPHSAPTPPLERPDPATNVPVMRWFGHLLETRPMAFWSGIWVSTFLIGVVAFGSLLSPSASERRSVSAIALGSDSGLATQPLENRGKVPLWMFGAIAVTCTAGSILVSRQLQPGTAPKPTPRLRRRVKNQRPLASARPVTPPAKPTKQRRKAKAKPPQRLKPYTPGEPLLSTRIPSPASVQPAIAPMPARSHSAGNPSFVVSKRNSRQPAVPVAVTIVPTEQAHPLDWNEPRLADDLDLRKQKPIQSLL